MSLIISNNSPNLDEANGNSIMETSTKAISPKTNDDDSTSEYTDPENSAPTELLAEFLTSIMRKDYVNALKYCKLILNFEPNNETAKDFYPELVQKVKERLQSSSSDQSDENCNYTSSLELVDDLDNEFLNHEMIVENYSDSSSLTSSNSTTTNGSMDLNSYSDEEQQPQPDQEDLINQFSFSSNNSSKSDQFPESMSSSDSAEGNRFNGGNYSPTFSFASLLLEESDDVNNNESLQSTNNHLINQPIQQVERLPHSSSASEQVPDKNSSNSPFTSKIVNMIKRKLN